MSEKRCGTCRHWAHQTATFGVCGLAHLDAPTFREDTCDHWGGFAIGASPASDSAGAGVEAGPEPASKAPWRRSHELLGKDTLPFIYSRTGRQVARCHKHGDAAAAIHRVNNWDALIAERDALRREVERLRSFTRCLECGEEMVAPPGRELLERAEAAESPEACGGLTGVATDVGGVMMKTGSPFSHGAAAVVSSGSAGQAADSAEPFPEAGLRCDGCGHTRESCRQSWRSPDGGGCSGKWPGVEVEQRLMRERDALRRKLDAVVPLLRAVQWEAACQLKGDGFRDRMGRIVEAWRALPADVRALAEGGDDG